MSRSAENRRDGPWDGIMVVLALATLMWLLEIGDSVADGRLDQYGIEPRDADGLEGVLAAPFLHAGFGHLISNTLPFLVMGFAIALKGATRVLAVTAIVALVSGIGTWIIAPANTVHIGASGVVFGYATYLMSQGFFDREVRGIAIGLVIAAIFGTALLGGLLPEEGISWQAHLFGAIGGVVAARFLKRERDRAPA